MGLGREDLTAIMAKLGQPKYRAAQLMDWLYGRGAIDLDEMTDLPLSLRQGLREGGYVIQLPIEAARQVGADGTVKFLFAMPDGIRVESVYIPEGPRRTVCLSTQAGCGMGCAFCATGQGGLIRNLSAGEIAGQVMRVRQLTGKRITNAVAMGQGEPLANYEGTVAAFRLLGADRGMGIAARHLSISTCGLPEGIARLAAEGEQWRLTVSLHAARDELRDKLLPINRRFPLAQLWEACASYCAATGRRITLAYAPIAGRNDSLSDARAVAAFCQGLLAHVNLILLNDVPGVAMTASTWDRVIEFRGWLLAAGVNATIRRPRGAEFSAACGQLRADPMEAGT